MEVRLRWPFLFTENFSAAFNASTELLLEQWQLAIKTAFAFSHFFYTPSLNLITPMCIEFHQTKRIMKQQRQATVLRSTALLDGQIPQPRKSMRLVTFGWKQVVERKLLSFFSKRCQLRNGFSKSLCAFLRALEINALNLKENSS